MTKSAIQRLKTALLSLPPDSHKNFRDLLNAEIKRDKANQLTSFAPVRKDWERWLSSDAFDWQIFATLTGQGGLTAKQLNRHVDKWFEMLVKRFNSVKPLGAELSEDDFKVFWVAETNTKNIKWSLDRFHLHLLIQCPTWIKKNLFCDNQYQQFNFFDVSWQYTQGRKPFVMVNDADTGLQYKKYLSKFRTHFVDLKPENSSNDDLQGLKYLQQNRVKYCAKYVSKEAIQFGFLNPQKVEPSFYYDDGKTWVASESYLYEYVKQKAQDNDN